MAGPRANNNGANGQAARKKYEKAGILARTGKLDTFVMGTTVSADGRTSVVVESISPEGVKVREMGTGSITDAWISPAEPVVGLYAKDDSFSIGDAKVQVTALTPDKLTIRITENGKSLTKSFGPWDEKNQKALYLSEKVRNRFWTLSHNGKQIVHLNVRSPKGPFESLVAYKEVVDVQDGSLWPYGPRFTARPET